MSQPKTQKPDIMHSVAAGIVRSRFVIILLFIAAAVYCALSLGRVKVNSDLTFFLPQNTETRRGLSIMEEEFTTYASANVMVANVTYEKARELADAVEEIEHVSSVDLDDTPSHYTNSAALLSVSFDSLEADPEVETAMGQIRELLSAYDTYIYSGIGQNYFKQLASEMVIVVLLAALVIVAVITVGLMGIAFMAFMGISL